MLQVLFSLTLFTSATLLFWIQLLTSKMLLPILGGSAAVWNTCMMFFQISLLLGYFYAYATDRWLRHRFEAFFHPALLLIAGIALPVSLHGILMPAGDANPVIWLLKTLLVMIGAPFLILAGTTPILQTWFARAGQKSSHDPYFLYAASNLGSLTALLSYPTLIEPNFHLTQQSQYWAIGYFLLIGLTILCALTVRKNSRTGVAEHIFPDEVVDNTSGKPDIAKRLHWVVLAFVPSSLLLGVTTHLTMDVASAPLFWIVPLVLYLLTFVLAFQKLFRIPETITASLQAMLIVPLAVILLSAQNEDVIPLFILHLTVFFLTALLCHQMLARLRPSTHYLTEFYLLLSLGGALGGIFNALFAPLLFNDVLEYPLVLVLACLLRPGILPDIKRKWLAFGDFALPAALFLLLILLDRYSGLDFDDLRDSGPFILMLIIAIVIFASQARPIRFGLEIAAIITAGFMIADTDHVLIQSRNFYGVLKVVTKDSPPLHTLYNGTTLHGSQAQDPDHRLQPLTYYHPLGPLGQLFAVLKANQTQRVGLVGLGAGTVACYEKPGENWSFFEINPADIAIASNPAFFTFLKDCPAHPDIVLGDARLSLAKQPDDSFDMIIFDAFTSDAIPIHLITREAVQLYLQKLSTNGLILFHISNRHLDLGPVVGNVAASLNLTARRWADDKEDEDRPYGKAASDWIIVTRNDENLQVIKNDDRWKPLLSSPGKSVWTDDYSNLLGALIY